jgi:uncharacterized protein YkwD
MNKNKEKNLNQDIKDSDADGLLDREEKKLGTNPFKKDSDDDGLSDYIEVNVYGTDPLNPDTDNDGVSDSEEVKRGTNPLGDGKLKDYFIPNKDNDYKPHALDPKRLAFYAFFAILAKSIVIITAIALPITAWLTPDILQEQSRKIVALTNEIRSDLDINKLNDSDLLNEAAYKKAEDMFNGQYFSHVGPDDRGLTDWLKVVDYDYKMAGENLAMGFASAEDVVNGWIRSRTHYANIIDPGYREIGVAMLSGVYNNRDSTLVAQYFGLKRDEGGNREKLHEHIINHEYSKIAVLEEVEEGKRNLRVEVNSNVNLNEAVLYFGNYKITLDEIKENIWAGSLTIFEEEEDDFFHPVVLASVKLTDRNGNISYEDLDWESITPIKTTLLKQYFFLKNNQSNLIKPIFSLSSVYFKILISFLTFLLILNIFIEVRKQHPHIIFYSFSLIGFLFILLYI